MHDTTEMARFDDRPLAGPRVILITDRPQDFAWHPFLAAAGARLLRDVRTADAAASLDAAVALDLVWCVADAPLPAALVARLQHLTARGECGLAIEAAPGALDACFADFAQGEVVLMADPSALERSFALHCLVGARTLAFHDPAAEPDPVQLQRLSDEVQRMAQTLAALTGPDGSFSALEQPRRSFTAPTPDARTPRQARALRASDIRAIIRRRRLRDHFFTGEIFADPAWDMLLDLMAARLDGKAVSVSSLCIAAAVPATTALRWIRSMTDAGLFLRDADPYDGRRVYIALSDAAAAAMTDYFAAINAPAEGPAL